MLKPKPDPEGENALIERIRGGDTEAYSILVERYQGPLIGFLSAMIRDTEAARDLAQETLIKAFVSLRGFETRNRASFSTWLFAIARNGCLDALRKRKRVFEELGEEHPELRQEPGQARHVDAGRFRDGLEKALARLGEKHRMAFELVLVQEFTYDQAALIMETKSGTVRSRVNRVRTFLREKLRHYAGKE